MLRVLSIMPDACCLLYDSPGDSFETLGLEPSEGYEDGPHEYKCKLMPLQNLFPLSRFIGILESRDLLEQCSFTGGRQSSLAISVFLIVKASST